MPDDHVDLLVAAWGRSRPDLDVEPLEVVGRVLRAASLLMQEIERALAALDLSYGDFDVISTLLREDDAGGTKPSRLARAALITTGAMTSRLDRLERLGLISRSADAGDRRAVRVRLTKAGEARAAEATDAVLEVDRRFLAPLSERQRAQLARPLRQLLLGIDTPPG